MAVQVSDLTRRIGISVAVVAAAAVLVAGCSSSSSGGSPAGNTTASSPAGGGASSSSSSASGGGGGGTDAFCTAFKNPDFAAIGTANGAAAAVKTWDQYAKDAPSEIKPNVEEIDKYIHDVVDGNYSDVAKISTSLGVDGQKIGTYYATHCGG